MTRKYVTNTGYIHDRIIYLTGFFIIVGLIVYILALNNFDFTPHLYVNCKTSVCENPLYKADCREQLTVLFFIPVYTTNNCAELPEYQWLNEKYLSFGEYGKKPPETFLLKYIKWLAILIVFFSFVANHYIYNKGKSFDIEIPITKKLVINREYIKKRFNENEEN